MYSAVKIRQLCPCGIVLWRGISSAEISTALRPFYFSVHPDLFGKYPEQRKVNESSLQQLSALIEAQQGNRSISLPPLPFYLRQKDMPDGNFKLVNIRVSGSSARDTIVNVLKSCDISTKYIDKIPSSKDQPKPNLIFSNDEFRKAYEEYNAEFEKMSKMRSRREEKKTIDNLIDWVHQNSSIARDKYASTKATRDQVTSLAKELCATYNIKEVKWESGWNISHIRGALASLVSMASQYSSDMANLEGRTVVFGQFTGVSLDGDVYLNIIDVRNEWLSLIKKVRQEDSALAVIPNYEKTLSSIFRDIHICRRKFMPKVSATQYVSHLRQLITSIGDFYGRGRTFPDSVPASLAKHQIVVEPEAGPLALSPTGQFSAPASCPADQLVAFLAEHLDTATLLLTEYSINKHVERALQKEVCSRLRLEALLKDDSVTPDRMIHACQRLLTRAPTIQHELQGNILNITHYYSVLSEGVLCIPWNFK